MTDRPVALHDVSLVANASVFLSARDLDAAATVVLQLPLGGGRLTIRLFGPPQVLERPLQAQASSGQSLGGGIRVAGGLVLTVLLAADHRAAVTLRGLTGMTGLLARLEAQRDTALRRTHVLRTESLAPPAALPDRDHGDALGMFLDRHNALYGALALKDVTRMAAGAPHDAVIARLLQVLSADGDPGTIALGLKLLMTSGKR